MTFVRKLLKFPLVDYFLLLKILYFLHLSKLYIVFGSLKNIVNWINRADLKPCVLEKKDWQFANKTAYYTNKLAKYVLFNSKCYDKALTVKKILNQKNISCALMMGVKTNEFDKIEAHAWIATKNRAIIGGEIAHQYVLVQSFH